LYDFFAGPGTDAKGVYGSPLRTLEVLREYSKGDLAAWGKVPVKAHFFDESKSKIAALKRTLLRPEWQISGVMASAEPADFARAFDGSEATLRRRDAAKLLIIDQFGVSNVTPEVFQKLVTFPCADFLFFISSNTLQRFRDHPSIKHKIKPAADFNQVHHAVLNYYRDLLPKGKRYYLAPFSIKKGSNIYGIVFGSAHPLGMDKFLTVAWGTDELNGNANFDINRDSIGPKEMLLDLGQTTRPLKLNVFEEALEQALRAKKLTDEVEVMELCFRHGVMRRHASNVLASLKKQGVIDLSFTTPSIDSLKKPRLIRYKGTLASC
jgi:three-Cys-motif partner protein